MEDPETEDVATAPKSTRSAKEKASSRAYYEANREKIIECAKAYKKANKDKVAAYNKTYHQKNRKRMNLAKRYGLSPEEVATIASSQNNRCLGCRKTFGDRPENRPCVDHCHTTSKIRGLLCLRCNLAVGYAGDNPATLKSLAEYLSGHKPKPPQRKSAKHRTPLLFGLEQTG